MKKAIEFVTRTQDGKIKIPKQYLQSLEHRTLRVIVIFEDKCPSNNAKQKTAKPPLIHAKTKLL
jgi:hypothetical protein